jgi:hypothetical protein
MNPRARWPIGTTSKILLSFFVRLAHQSFKLLSISPHQEFGFLTFLTQSMSAIIPRD